MTVCLSLTTRNRENKASIGWTYSGVIFAYSYELSQLTGAIGGTFDLWDLAAISLAHLMAVLTLSRERQKNKTNQRAVTEEPYT